MISSKKQLVAFSLLSYNSITIAQDKCEFPSSLICRRTTEAPILDADLSDWENVEGVLSPITSALGGLLYEHGNMGLKCLYDDEKIYFAMEVPGRYRFDSTNNHLCASMSYMSKIGSDATYSYMGGCPEAMQGCPMTPSDCDNYAVDLGGHWELRTTEMGVTYGVNVEDGTGNDLLANKDDEYGYSPFCKFDDDGDNAGNEWAGAWSHTAPTESGESEEVGTYIFEMSRLLRTESPETDTQYEAGNTYDFGAAFFDPYETDSGGWSDHGHYVTGCSLDWMSLVLEDSDATSSVAATETSSSGGCVTPDPLICSRITTPPTLDGDLEDWADVNGVQAPLTAALSSSVTYEYGDMELKCTYDDENIYFAMVVPGRYRFNSTNNHLCASMSYMTRIGEDATYSYMGGCPEAMTGCPLTAGVCDSYAVDLGGHWELRTTEQNVLYGINVDDGTGNDLLANKDDEYGYSPFCKFDDDGENAGNEWAGAWSHSTSTDGSVGDYVFEMSRLLQTDSPETDTQFEAGNTYDFGAAFWDPYELGMDGWSDHGHYVTGCSSNWMSLVLDTGGDSEPVAIGETSTTVAEKACVAPASIVCRRAAEAPTLNGDLSDWANVEGIESSLTAAMDGLVMYPHGVMELKCQFDDEKIYFAMSVPGPIRFDAEDNHKCAAMSYMSKIGDLAGYAYMGGCPDALTGCPVVSGSCDEYAVDLGGHWELASTEQGVLYGVNVNDGTGNDLVANKDDEYGYSPYCRFDDDGENAGNEWEGAWVHTATSTGLSKRTGGDESYIFEMSRLLVTESPETDTQYEIGNTYKFGAAFWDPYETEDGGWSDHGHYVTGCSNDWMDLILEDTPVSAAAAPIAEKPQQCVAPLSPLTCQKTTSPPELDGSLADWTDVAGIETPITAALGGMMYPQGNMQLKCQYNDENIYFAMEVPGMYRFDMDDNHKCAAVSYMTAIGNDAEYLYMGNCPDAMSGCPVTTDSCDSFRVDLGGHWELRTTQQRVRYGVNATSGTGDDVIANNDDEYAFGAFCRLDDDGENAGNEWAGAWSHSSSLTGANARSGPPGSYIFEMSRLLTTNSPETDTQFEAGNTYSFGAAFWDPFETEENGWSDHGHYVTGCSNDWIDLFLDDGSGASDTGDDTGVKAAEDCELSEPLICLKTSEAPALDGSLAEWREIVGVNTPITAALGGAKYPNGNMELRCVYDDENIYLAMNVPGKFRFDADDNHKCASMSYMTKIGEDADYVYMGNCPDAMAGCPVTSSVCDSYRVDLGGHWELKTTQERVLYGPNAGTGDDAVANKDDEYAVGAFCRPDDDGENAANEWSGAWSHTSTLFIDGNTDPNGSYIFEMSRTLRTASPETDAQYEAGQIYSFGAAFWDPFETEGDGWSDHGHYITGCSVEWIELHLVDNGTVSDAIATYAASRIASAESGAATTSMVVLTLSISLVSVLTYLLI